MVLNLHIKKTKNNFLVTLTNNKQQPLLKTNYGQLKISRESAKNKKRSFLWAHMIGLILKKKKINYVNLIYTGLPRELKKLLFGLTYSGIKLIKLIVKQKVPFNGCKLKKKKRK